MPPLLRRALPILGTAAAPVVLAVFGVACGFNDPASGPEVTVVADGGDGDSEDETATGNGAVGPGGFDVLVDEAAARQALDALVKAMAAADYPTAATLLINEGISDLLLVQLRIHEDEALRPGGLEKPLAAYCASNDCTAEVRVGEMIEAEFLSAVFDVRVDIDGEPTAINVPVGAFEGQYTVGLLPFGLIPPEAIGGDEGGRPRVRTTTTTSNSNAGGGDRSTVDTHFAAPDDDDEDRLPGADSPQGWRLAPVAANDDPVVTVWNRNGWMFPGHDGWPAAALPGSPDVAPLSQVVNAASVIVYQREGDSETIWLHHPDKPDEELVTVPKGEFLDLVGARVIDLDESVIFYTHRLGTMPEDTKEVLYSMALSDGRKREIVATGGWESGTRFTILDDAYPEVVGTWAAEGYLGQMIVNLEAGEVVYVADEVGYSCFDDEPGCPAYDTAALYNDRIYGIRSEWNGTDRAVDTRSLFRFDPETGEEQVVARFAWSNGLWYPRQIMVLGDDLVVSVEDGNGVALPAVVIDPASGEARTLQRAGFVGPAYLS